MEVNTRNNQGIATKGILVCNFGADYDATTIDDTELAAKRFKGALELAFAASAPQAQADDKQAVKAEGTKDAVKAEGKKDGVNAEGKKDAVKADGKTDGKSDGKADAKTKEANPKAVAVKSTAETAAAAPKYDTAQLQETPAKKAKIDAAADSGTDPKAASSAGAVAEYQVDQTLSDGGKVLAVMTEGKSAGAALIYRSDGSLSLAGPSGWNGNRKIGPNALLWKIPNGSAVKGDTGVKWKFDGALSKHLVVLGQAIMPMSQVVEQKSATSIAKHQPDKFTKGKAPTMSTDANYCLTTSHDIGTALAKKGDTSCCNILWSVSVKKENGQIIPCGAYLVLKKQVIVPCGSEIRV